MTRARVGFFWMLIGLLALFAFGMWWSTSCGGTCFFAGLDARDKCARNGGTPDQCENAGTDAQLNCALTSSRCQ